VFGLDDRIANVGTGGSLVLALAVALLLGLRHATDPDHLTALSTLVLSGDERRGARRARRLGLAWGLGHATTLILFGLPFVLLHAALPDGAQRAAEAGVGLVIVVLALRLLIRWRRGYFHEHPHEHGGVTHVHPHVHEGAHGHAHEHEHAEALGRTPRAAYGIGLLHGLGGSAGVGVLLIGAMPDHTVAAVALVLFAGATALSMAFVSAAWGGALAAKTVARRIERVAPLVASASLAFGVWYGLAALS
jgi:ABC-type nickel/cobalt efflux system permease component RcnA